MTWQNPKTDWKAGDIPTASDFNRIEGNIEELENTKETPAGAQAKADAAAGAVQAELNTHKADSVAHGTASKAEAQAGTSHASYMTPLRVKEAIQALQSVASVNNKTGAVTLAKGDVGLANVDNVKQMPIAGGTFTGVAVAQTNTSYTTRQLRNVIMSTANPSGGSNGDIWIKYK